MTNYIQVHENIAQVAKKAGRSPEEITLVVVSKTRSFEEISPLIAVGCHDFGENRIQEALPKIEQAPAFLRWHFIGPLQKNKVNKAISKFALIHSVDSYELAEKISQVSQAASATTAILLQVNTSGEQSKQGLTPEELKQQITAMRSLPSLKIEGLMTMAPFTEDKGVIRNCFRDLRLLRDELHLKHLSMGMSHDYQMAIEEGATILRIGTAIFKDEE